jgi:hypothetical protein
MARHRLVFYNQAGPVGCFRGRGYPTSRGRVEYDPFRGDGHAYLSLAIKDGKSARCWFFRRGKPILLEVIGEEFVEGAPGFRSRWFLDVSRVASEAVDG